MRIEEIYKCIAATKIPKRYVVLVFDKKNPPKEGDTITFINLMATFVRKK